MNVMKHPTIDGSERSVSGFDRTAMAWFEAGDALIHSPEYFVYETPPSRLRRLADVGVVRAGTLVASAITLGWLAT